MRNTNIEIYSILYNDILIYPCPFFWWSFTYFKAVHYILLSFSIKPCYISPAIRRISKDNLIRDECVQTPLFGFSFKCHIYFLLLCKVLQSDKVRRNGRTDRPQLQIFHSYFVEHRIFIDINDSLSSFFVNHSSSDLILDAKYAFDGLVGYNLPSIILIQRQYHFFRRRQINRCIHLQIRISLFRIIETSDNHFLQIHRIEQVYCYCTFFIINDCTTNLSIHLKAGNRQSDNRIRQIVLDAWWKSKCNANAYN